MCSIWTSAADRPRSQTYATCIVPTLGALFAVWISCSAGQKAAITARIAWAQKGCGNDEESRPARRQSSLVAPHSRKRTSEQGCTDSHVAKRLGHANANITVSIYAHALEADELAAAKIWDDAMTDVIGANKRQPNRSLAKSSAGEAKKPEVIDFKVG
jgi:hypothetical protein